MEGEQVQALGYSWLGLHFECYAFEVRSLGLEGGMPETKVVCWSVLDGVRPLISDEFELPHGVSTLVHITRSQAHLDASREGRGGSTLGKRHRQ